MISCVKSLHWLIVTRCCSKCMLPFWQELLGLAWDILNGYNLRGYITMGLDLVCKNYLNNQSGIWNMFGDTF
jgi:hypothetical protein